MAQASLPPLGWYPPSPRPRDLSVLVGVVFVVVVLIIMAGMFVGLASPFGGFPFGALCGFFLIPIVFVVIVVALALAGNAQRRTLPPPPPIQQPMVPAGIRGPAELACPNCGAAPTNVDRFGIATCAYCGTRYLVR